MIDEKKLIERFKERKALWAKDKVFDRNSAEKHIGTWNAAIRIVKQLAEKGCCYETPCKIGATVWVIAKCKDVNSVLDASYENATGYYCPYDMYNKCPHECCDECEKLEDKLAVFEDAVETIFIEAYGISVGTKYTNTVSTIGDLIFLSKEAADEALESRGLE